MPAFLLLLYNSLLPLNIFVLQSNVGMTPYLATYFLQLQREYSTEKGLVGCQYQIPGSGTGIISNVTGTLPYPEPD